MTWAVGLMAVPERRHQLLPNTLKSLKAAGFTIDRLFVDGTRDHASWEKEFGIPVTVRFPKILIHGNWVLGMEELFIRHPKATRYAMFQDDIIATKNLRPYLDQCVYPETGYWNLYTAHWTSQVLPPSKDYVGWYLSNQLGRGALGLVFDRPTLSILLEHKHMIVRANRDTPEDVDGWRKVDGGIVTAMRKVGYMEWVHSPSLLQHTGIKSTVDKRKGADGTAEDFPPYFWGTNSGTFQGEDFDALKFLEHAHS